MNKTLLRRMIKATSIRDMQGNWWKAFFVSLLESAIVMWIISYIPFRIPTEEELIVAGNDMAKVASLILPKEITPKILMSVGVTLLLYLFVMSPLGVGKSKYFLKVAKGEKATLGDVFSVYANIKTVFSSVLLTIIVFLFAVLSFVAFMIIPAAVMIFAVLNKSIALYDLSFILIPVFSLLFAVWISRYRFITFIYAYDEKGVFASLYKYIKYMKKKNGESLVLGASYFGWIFMMYMMPFLSLIYQCLSSTVYAKYVLRFRGELSFGELETPSPEV